MSSFSLQDPIKLLKNWLHEASSHPKQIKQAGAMVLSTVSAMHFWKVQAVSSRVVLLKEIQKDQLIFYTNYTSPKAKGIYLYYNSKAAINFYWPMLDRQILLEGFLRKTSSKISDQYWSTRSRESQISQYISKQSTQLESRQGLEKLWQEAKKQFEGKSIPRPKHWGGIAFTPNKLEFWQERPHRLHERLLFTKTGFKKTWSSYLLYP